MKILKRYHNSTGTTVQYLVSSGERTARLSAREVVSLYNSGLVGNVTLMRNGEFRAKPGYHITTESLTYKPSNSKSVVMHTYIDPQIRSDFTANITIEDIAV